ncbi:MAG: GAF domain-containing protein [Verrucomicrobiota bacterium]
MISARARLLRQPSFVRLGSELESHIETTISNTPPAELIGFIDEQCLQLLNEAFRAVCSNEGMVWLADCDEHHLVASYNTGLRADELVGFRQPIGSGIISMVYAQQQPYCENEIGSNAGHDNTLDQKVSKHTKAMIAVPLYFAFRLRGIISCVQFEEGGCGDSGFNSSHVQTLVKVSNTIERLVDSNLLHSALGLNDG